MSNHLNSNAYLGNGNTFFSFFPEFSPRKLAHKIQPTKNHEKKIKNQHEKKFKKSSLEALKTYKLLFNRKEIC